MPIRESYSDTFTGEADKNIRAILYSTDDEDSSLRKLKRTLVRAIDNELTPRQREVIIMYYYKNISIVRIAEQTGISPQAVSGAMARARMRLFRIMQYYL